MEQTLKVYVYAEGERPIFHQPPLKGIYASEGWFMKLLKANKKFVTKKPKKAHLFYLPFSTRMLEVTLYVPDSHDRKPLIDVLSNYVQTIKTKYSFWNRTSGADHFLVACHDWVRWSAIRVYELIHVECSLSKSSCFSLSRHRLRRGRSWITASELCAMLTSKKGSDLVKTRLSLRRTSKLLRSPSGNSGASRLPRDEPSLSSQATCTATSDRSC